MGFDLDGKTVLVTGATRGIGRAIAVAVAEAGADVVGLARTKDSLLDLGHEIESMGRRFLPVVEDLGDVEAVGRAVPVVWDWSGGIDVLINAAGTIIRSEPPDVKPSEWDQIMAVNARGPFFLTQEIGTRMLIDGGGSVVNIASLAAEFVTKASVVYQASKAALVQLTRALAVRWAPDVRVNAVGPGYIRTSLTEQWLADEANLGYVENRTPQGRVGTPDDVVGAVLFLASPASGYITGQHLFVDGGWSVG